MIPDNDTELFNEAMNPVEEVTPEETPEPETPENPKPEELEAAAKAEVEEEPVETDPVSEEPQEPEKGNRVPLHELLATRERAQKAEMDRERVERELEAMRQQIAASQQRQNAQPEPDIFAEPEKWQARQQEMIQSQAQQFRMQIARVEAIATHGADTVQKAIEAASQAEFTQPHIAARIQASPNPFAEAVRWHKEQSVQQEIGEGGIDAFKSSLREQLLNDPEFRKQAMEKWQEQARSPNSPQPKTKLPPSLAKTPASRAAAAQGDMSDSDLLNEALGSR